MLRHLKRRQQELENTVSQARDAHGAGAGNGTSGSLSEATNRNIHNNNNTNSFQNMPLTLTSNQAIDVKRRQQQQQQKQKEENKQQKRVRGRRSSKPAMEKRRRARINECLDILKSYVLNDSANLTRLGIDLNANENQLDEESIARQILKSSGLINRHRGRKNPNKLEKADILELTVDYVRRLHEQRDELLVNNSGNCLRSNQRQDTPPFVGQMMAHNNQHQHNRQQNQPLPLMANNCGLSYGLQVVPAHLNEPLTLDLSPKSRQIGQVNTSSTPPMLQAYRPPPNTPLTPPSSASSLQGSADALEQPSFQQQHHHQNQLSQMQLLTQVLDGRYKLYPDWVSMARINNNDQ